MLNKYSRKSPGRPTIDVDLALIIQLHDEESLGWMKGAEEYSRKTGKWISKDTFRRWYLMLDKFRSLLNILFDGEKTTKDSLDGDASS